MKLLKYLLILLLVLAIGIAGGLIYVKTALPDVGKAPDIKVEGSSEQIARGKYLANSVSVCIDCHSERDWSKFSGPIVEGTFGQGGEEFNQQMGLPGKYYARNITPYGLKEWSDGEIYRAITSGVNKEGEALFPIMPHPYYGRMAKEDILAIIAYIKTLSPIQKDSPKASSDFPMNFIINTIPKKADHQAIPDKKDLVAYGAYLVNAAACKECHTKQDKGQPLEGMDFAGGFMFPLIKGGTAISANITPDAETGIGSWTKETFVKRFKSYDVSAGNQLAEVKDGNFNTVMPWTMYATMETEDLEAIFAYLQTVKPVKNQVTKFISSNQ